MNEQNIIQLIKKDKSQINLNPVVYIYGYENLLKKQFIDKLKSKDKDFHFFWGDEATLHQIKDVFSSGALFSSGNEAVLWDIDAFISKLNKNEKQQFVEFLEKIHHPDMIFLVSLKEKLPNKEPFKSIYKLSTIINSPKLTPKAFEISVYKKLQNNKKEISVENLKYLISKLPKDLYNAKQEIEKLLTYTANKDEITKEDIDNIISAKPETNVFSFIDAFFKRDKTALKHLVNLIEQGYHPFEIQSLILTYANRILLYKSYRQQNIPKEEIFLKMKISYKPQQSTIENLSKNLTIKQIIDLIQKLYEIEIKQKVYYQDINQTLEKLVLEFIL